MLITEEININGRMFKHNYSDINHYIKSSEEMSNLKENVELISEN